jgi:hypothetical protein
LLRVDELARLGCTRCSAEQRVCFIVHLDRRLTAQRLDVGDLNAAVVGRVVELGPGSNPTTRRCKGRDAAVESGKEPPGASPPTTQMGIRPQ